MHILLLTVFCSVLIFCFYKKGILGAISHPFTYIVVFHLVFYYEAAVDETIRDDVDLMILVSFMVLSVSYLIAYSLIPKHWIEKYFSLFCPGWDRDYLDTQKHAFAVVATCSIVIFLVAITFVVHKIWAFDSYELALLHFYAYKPVRHSWFMSNMIKQLMFVALLAIMIGQISCLFQKVNWNIFIFPAIFLYSLCLATTGIRGYQVKILMVLFFCDVFYSYFRKKVRFSKLTCLFFIWFLVLSLSLSIFRDIDFDSIDSFQDYIFDGSFIEDFQNRKSTNKYLGSLSDSVGYTRNMYEDEESRYGWLTFYTIICNPIPRPLWRGKPLNFGTEFAYDLGFSENSGISIAAGIPGEGYAGQGWLGIVVLSMFLGVYGAFWGVASRVVLQHKNYICLCFFFLTFVGGSYFVRGDILSGIALGVYPFLGFSLLMFIVLHIFRPKS